MKKLVAMAAVLCASALLADVYLVNGKRIEGEVHEMGGKKTICTDEMCMILPPDAVKVEEGEDAAAASADASAAPAASDDAAPAAGQVSECPAAPRPARLAQGFMKAPEFLAFLNGAASDGGAQDSPFAGKSWWLVLVLTLFGGLCMNLTPCVLPMVPINLMVIGKSAARGTLYGLGIALAYGAMGALAAVGGMAFGEIQGNPWFNAAIAALFVLLALALMGVFFIDLSKGRGGFAKKKTSMLPGLFAFFMGVVSAVLAGACVAPILIAVLLLTAKLYAEGTAVALGLPFVLGLGMALPWPFAGAGMQVLPKPGAWMKYVNKAFGILVLGFAAWYGYLAYRGFAERSADSRKQPAAVAGSQPSNVLAATPATFAETLAAAKRPVLVDCWATWCKNCAAMEKTTFEDESVKSALEGYSVIKLQAEDISELMKLEGFGDVKGLPAFLIVE